MRYALPWLIAAVGLPLAVACNGNVVVDSGTGNTGGTGGAGGTGGTGGTGAAPQVCGGKQGLQCPAGEWCQYSPSGSCGATDGAGTCQPPPGACPPTDCPGVCGCDGQFYCDACNASAAGVDVASTSTCYPIYDAGPPPPPEYAAYQLATNLPRYAIARTEVSANRCTWIVVAAGSGASLPNIQTTMGWNVESAFISDAASDCQGPPGAYPMPAGQVSKASDGGGDIKQDSTTFPCFIDLHVKLAFQPIAPWVPSGEALDATQLQVQGGGCGG